MLKMITDKGTGETYVLEEKTGKVHTFSAGHSGLEEAMHFFSLKVFHEVVSGRPIGFERENKNPVRSLIPPVRKKVINFYDLGEDTA